MINNQTREFSQFASRPDNFQRSKNKFDLSHDHKTTFSMGQLIPFLTVETLPGDEFDIDSEIMCRFAPLYLPIMHRCDLSVNYFYVPWRIIWEQWEKYITQQEDLLAPYFEMLVDSIDDDGRYSILNYMGFPTDDVAPGGGNINVINVNAGPLAAYWKIYNEYYRNSQIQEEILIELQAGENDITGWTLYMGNAPLFVANRLWNRDYFTAALPTPQIGEEVLIPMYNPDYLTEDGAQPRGPWRLRAVDDHAVAGVGAVSHGGWGGATDRGLKTTVDTTGTYLDIQETAAPLRDFRLAARMLEFLERLMRTGQRYRDFLKGHFGVDPDPGTIDLPVYIGGYKGRIIISEVMATAQTINVDADTVTPLGAYAGQALAMESGKSRIKYFCREHGFIIGIVNIQPRTSYFQGLSKMWTRGVGVPNADPGTVYDYAFEQFAGIGDQEIRFKELRYDYNNVQDNINHNEATFGYIPRYSEYRWQNDVVSGEMRTLWLSFHLGRIFTNDAVDSLTSPVLNHDFVTCFPDVSRAFQVSAAQDHEIYAWIFNNVYVWRSLPKFGVPTL